jgi:hypothetical protein
MSFGWAKTSAGWRVFRRSVDGAAEWRGKCYSRELDAELAARREAEAHAGEAIETPPSGEKKL